MDLGMELGILNRTLLEQMREGVYLVDRDRRIQYWNPAAERITGFAASEVVGSHCHNRVLMHMDESGHLLCEGGCPLHKTLHDKQSRELRVYFHHKMGHRVPVMVRCVPWKDEDGELLGAVEFFWPEGREEQLQERLQELERMALLDPLTRLVNRRHLDASLDSRLGELRRFGWPFGLLFVDVDRFKQVNDSFGHEVGDKVLKLVSLTLVNSVRPFDMVGRWGGEEFLAILTNVTPEQLMHVAERSRLLVEGSDLKEGSHLLSVTVSLGATMARPEDDPASLFSRVDKLMYASKRAGRNQVTGDIQDP